MRQMHDLLRIPFWCAALSKLSLSGPGQRAMSLTNQTWNAPDLLPPIGTKDWGLRQPAIRVTWQPPYRGALLAPTITARLGWRIRRQFQ